MNIRTLIAGGVLATLGVPASGQSLLNQLIQQIGKKKATPSGSPASAGSGGGRFTASITPAQTATIDKLLAQPLQDPAIAADRAGAMALIRLILATGSCAQSDAAWNSLNRYHMTPTSSDASSGSSAPNSNTKYHDKTMCLDVLRVTDWSKPANNAVNFHAYYLATDSGEAKSQPYQLQKGSDGQWMIRYIGFGMY